jgi:PhnB protein
MVSRLNPYISFSDDARPAMEFYRSVFGGELTMNTFGELGACSPESPDAKLLMHAMLSTPSGFTLMAADSPTALGAPAHQPVASMSVSVSGDDAEALRGYWDKLSADGTVRMPLEKQSWGDEFGMCVDKFGIPWMVNIAAPTVS